MVRIWRRCELRRRKRVGHFGAERGGEDKLGDKCTREDNNGLDSESDSATVEERSMEEPIAYKVEDLDEEGLYRPGVEDVRLEILARVDYEEYDRIHRN